MIAVRGSNRTCDSRDEHGEHGDGQDGSQERDDDTLEGGVVTEFMAGSPVGADDQRGRVALAGELRVVCDELSAQCGSCVGLALHGVTSGGGVVPDLGDARAEPGAEYMGVLQWLPPARPSLRGAAICR